MENDSRTSAILHRSAAVTPARAVRGEGCYLYDDKGKQYLDASGGAAVSCLGHGDRDVADAIKAQLDAFAFAHTGFFTSEPAERLARFLVDRAGSPLTKAYFLSGGSEAVESALKLARQYFVEKAEPQRRHIIGRWQSFHGNTLGALSVGGNVGRREVYAPLLAESHHVDPCFAYRQARDGESEAAYVERLAGQLEAKINELGPDQVIGFIAETVVGATSGAVPPVAGYFKRVREICNRYGILLILDEVMCGMGRTGSLFAFEQEGITPDIVVLAKGLGGGYQPIGAILLSAEIDAAIRNGSGAFMHGHTYMAHPTACAAALAVQQKIEKEDLLANVRSMGAKLEAALRDRFGNHAHIGDIRGRGLFWGLELVADRATKTPFDPALKVHARIKTAAMAEGLICYPSGGTIDGKSGDHILLAPPYIIGESHIAELIEKLGGAVDNVLGDIT